jgi:hypothetical protein
LCLPKSHVATFWSSFLPQRPFRRSLVVFPFGLRMLWPGPSPSRLVYPISCGYIIDGTFKYCADLPTYREHLGINGLSAEEARKVLESEVDRFEGIVADSENWSFPGMFIKCCFQLACFSECDFHGVTIVSTRMFVIGMYD